jgi:WD40 repeat protein
MRAYLASQLADPAGLHAALLEAWGDPHHLPDDYAWRWHAYHLKEAGRAEALRALLCDFDWLQAKLDATDVNALIVDYDFTPDDADLRLVKGTIRLAAHVLARDKTQLAGQLLGRLLGQEAPEIQTMLEQTKEWRAAPWLRPLTPSLTPPGGPLIRTLQGHTSGVRAVAVTPDGRRAVSGSDDHTLKVWDLERGEELATLQGHTSWVSAVAVTPDGRRAVSASGDDTLKVWDISTGLNAGLESGEVIADFSAEGALWACAVAPDGETFVAAGASGRVHFLRLEGVE